LSKRRSNSMPCVVRDSATSYARCAGLIDKDSEGPQDCRVIDSVRKLLALGLSTEEIEDLDIRQPMLQAVCEYARLEHDESESAEKVAEAVGMTLSVISEQVRNLDLEIEMLNLRRKALHKRTQVLTKLARSLSSERTKRPSP